MKLRKILSLFFVFCIMLTLTMPIHAEETDAQTDTEDETAASDDVARSSTSSIFNSSVGSALLIELNTGKVLYSKDASKQRFPASLTKIMTCLLALESGDIGRNVIITQDMLAYDEEGSTKLGLKLGDNITIHDLVVGMLLLSGNDCAQAVAIDLGGSFDGFASMMNERASEIGMFDTHFVTPSGLDAEGHYSTAYDMALLGAEAMKNEDFAELCSLASYQVKFGNPPSNYPLNAHNYLLEGQRYGVEGCNGIKTGYTDSAGYCLVSHVERNGVKLVCCTLGAYSYWANHEQLYDYAFSKYVQLQPNPDLEGAQVKLVGGAQQNVGVYCYVDQKFSVHENQVGGVYYDVTLKDKLSHDETTPKMLDLIIESRTIDLGVIYEFALGNSISSVLASIKKSGAENLASLAEKNAKSFQKNYEKIVDAYAGIE